VKYVEQLSAKLLSLKKSSFVENSFSDISVTSTQDIKGKIANLNSTNI